MCRVSDGDSIRPYPAPQDEDDAIEKHIAKFADKGPDGTLGGTIEFEEDCTVVVNYTTSETPPLQLGS